jgi:hypothetical protein
MLFYKWQRVYNYVSCLLDEGIIKDRTAQEMLDTLASLKIAIVEYDDNKKEEDNT